MTTSTQTTVGTGPASKSVGMAGVPSADVERALAEARVPIAPEIEAARPGLPVKPPLAAILEIVLLIFVPAALDYFVPGFPTLADLQPHPFWLPVLLVSLQYGTVSGLLAAGCSIAVNAFLGWPEQEVGENHFTYLLRVWTQPMLWVATALVLGQFRMRQIERKQELVRQLNEMQSQRKSIAEYATNLRARCERLERELVGRRVPGKSDILALLGSLPQASGAGARETLGQCLTAAFGACQASVFIRERQTLSLLEQHGWPVKPRWKSSLGAADPLYVAMTDAARPVSVLVPGDEAVLAGEGIAAAPVVSRLDGRTIGIVKIEAIEPSEIDASLPQRLTAFAAHLAPLLEGANALQASGEAAMSARFPASSAPRPRLWRQVRWRRGERQAQEPQRPTRVG